MTAQYIIDTSALIQGFIEDSYSLRVATLMHMVTVANSARLHLPEFCLVECTNVIWKRVRFQGETQENARRILADLQAFPLSAHASVGLLPRALDIGIEVRLAIYDCVHIALAEILNLPLITVDERQAAVAASIGVTLKPITDFPELTESD